MNTPNEVKLSFYNDTASAATNASLSLTVPSGQYFKGIFSIFGKSLTNESVNGQLKKGSSYIAFSQACPNGISGTHSGGSCLPEVTLGEGTYNWANTQAMSGTVDVAVVGVFYKKYGS